MINMGAIGKVVFALQEVTPLFLYFLVLEVDYMAIKINGSMRMFTHILEKGNMVIWNSPEGILHLEII